MKIKLNRNIGDVVWLMYDNQAVSSEINSIYYAQFISNLNYEEIVTVERYYVLICGREVSCEKEQLFSDKESLIKSL